MYPPRRNFLGYVSSNPNYVEVDPNYVEVNPKYAEVNPNYVPPTTQFPRVCVQ